MLRTAYVLNTLKATTHPWVTGLGVSGFLKFMYKWPIAVTFHTRGYPLARRAYVGLGS